MRRRQLTADRRAAPRHTRAGINPGIPSRWRDADALGIPGLKPVALGEARTPLLSRRLVGLDVAVKMETQNSTGSFKDRGSSVRLSVLRAQVVTPVLEDSSGNGGLSVAAYCAAAGIHAKILAPATSSPAKLSQSRFHGAEVELRPGTRQDTADEAR
ncbi:pyridoxal-phosphate dependent enzyme [Streptomyces sp. NPDC060006]|uniref:pyridoxal-phosphate dependent enzyme n=1 Tax=unclassified Streptomyces TaxID=2593676 RepID=UPI003684981F